MKYMSKELRELREAMIQTIYQADFNLWVSPKKPNLKKYRYSKKDLERLNSMVLFQMAISYASADAEEVGREIGYERGYDDAEDRFGYYR